MADTDVAERDIPRTIFLYGDGQLNIYVMSAVFQLSVTLPGTDNAEPLTDAVEVGVRVKSLTKGSPVLVEVVLYE